MNILAFILCAAALLLIFSVSGKSRYAVKSITLKDKIKMVNAKPQNNIIAKTIRRTTQIVEIEKLYGGITTIWCFSALCAAAGLFISIAISNMFLAPVLMCVLATMPFVVATLRWQRKEKQISESLAIALGGITTSYLRGNNTIVRAIEENMPHFKGAVAQVFSRFLMRTSMVDSSTEDALYQMKDSIHNAIFARWVDAVIRCQYDHNLKSTLPQILDKFSELRTIENETEIIMKQPRQTFYIMLGAAVFSPFLLYFLNADWWGIIATQGSGKFLVAAHICAIVIAMAVGINAMRSISSIGDQI